MPDMCLSFHVLELFFFSMAVMKTIYEKCSRYPVETWELEKNGNLNACFYGNEGKSGWNTFLFPARLPVALIIVYHFQQNASETTA